MTVWRASLPYPIWYRHHWKLLSCRLNIYRLSNEYKSFGLSSICVAGSPSSTYASTVVVDPSGPSSILCRLCRRLWFLGRIIYSSSSVDVVIYVDVYVYAYVYVDVANTSSPSSSTKSDHVVVNYSSPVSLHHSLSLQILCFEFNLCGLWHQRDRDNRFEAYQ